LHLRLYIINIHPQEVIELKNPDTLAIEEHPRTGNSKKYIVGDRFHEANYPHKDPRQAKNSYVFFQNIGCDFCFAGVGTIISTSARSWQTLGPLTKRT
jgi:hypothetical protein